MHTPTNKVRTRYNYDRDALSKATGLACIDKSRTRQSDAEEADIVNIVARFGLTGQLPTNVRMPEYMDFDEAFDFQSAQNALVMAKHSFMQMPYELRKQMDHDPQKFLEWCHDEKNKEDMKKYGLFKPPVEAPKPQEVIIKGGKLDKDDTAK